MNNVNPDKRQDSGAMSQTRRQTLRKRQREGDFLADQAADARAAMIHTAGDIKESLWKFADVGLCAKQHPWFLIGSAVAAGFAAGVVVAPAQPKSFNKTQSSADTKLHPTSQGWQTARTKQSFFLSIVGTALASILRSVIRASIAAAVHAKDPPSGNARATEDVTDAGVAESGAA